MEEDKIIVLHPAVQMAMETMENNRKSNETIWKKPTEEQQTIIMGELNRGSSLSRFFRKRSKLYKTIDSKKYLCCVGIISHMYTGHSPRVKFYYLEISSETIKYTLRVSYSEYCRHDIGYMGHLIMICNDKKENKIRFV